MRTFGTTKPNNIVAYSKNRLFLRLLLFCYQFLQQKALTVKKKKNKQKKRKSRNQRKKETFKKYVIILSIQCSFAKIFKTDNLRNSVY